MVEIDRRTVLAAPFLNLQRGPRVAVVGAGAFGGWTALHLQRMGAAVTLYDSWGPGNSRASSGGETRITRAAYVDRIYADLTVRALEIWKENEKKWNRRIFSPCGVIRLQGRESKDSAKFVQTLREARVKHEMLPVAEARKRFPQFDFTGIEQVLWEPEHGMLRARRGCEAVFEAFQAEGGTYEQRQWLPGNPPPGDVVIWACGPWLGKLFPLGKNFRATRQEVFFFGVPPGEGMYQENRMPCWIDDSSERFHYYGTPGNDWRGFKLGDDAYGPDFDPDVTERRVSDAQLARLREYMRIRFPKMADAPVVETRVCQYEVTLDAHLILDQVPGQPKQWMLGGGSGHGYKLGAAVGEMMAQVALGKHAPEPLFRLARFRV